MSDPVYFRILDTFRELIGEFVSLVGEGDLPGIPKHAIVLSRTPMRLKQGEEWGHDLHTPGIILSPSNTIQVPLESGDNEHDDVLYPVLVQILDSDESRFSEKSIKSQMSWSTGIRQMFHCQNLRHEVFDSAGYVDFAFMTNQDVLDENMWVLHRRCVEALSFKVLSRESRNEQGSA